MDAFDGYGAAKSPNELSRTDSYDREAYNTRDPYRERRRSPIAADRRARGPPRNRSRSPNQIDRYQPDRSRDDFYRGREDHNPRDRRRSSPQVQPGGHKSIDRYIPGDDAAVPRVIPVNQLRDPLLEASQVGFSYFAEWWKAEQDIKQQRERQKNGGRREPVKESREEQRSKIQAAYDQYKLNWNTRMAKVFVHAHKYDTWFRERYVTEVRDPLRQKVLDYRRGLFDLWDADLNQGTFDDFTLEGIYKSESNGAGGLVEKEEGEATAAAEVLAVSDLLPSKGGDIRDPVAFQPTLLVKTITPAVSRERMEEFCKEHLGDGEGGYKWLSLSDPNPGKKFHRLGWIMLNRASESVEDEEVHRRGSRDDEDQETHNVEQDKSNRGQNVCERALNEINNKTIHDPEKGDFTVHVGIHHPQDHPRKKALWDLFSAPERVDRDLELAIRLVRKLDSEMGSDCDGLGRIEQRVDELAGKGYLQPQIPAVRSKKEEHEEDEDMEEGEEEEDAVEEDVDDEDLLIKKKKLDLLVEYLRRVYNFCFYCVFECDSVHELQRKCAGGHLRRPRASLTSAAKETARATANGEPFPLKRQPEDGEADGSPMEERKAPLRTYGKNQLQKAYNWVKTFEEKLLMILEPENVDLRKLGGKPLEEGLEEDMSKFVKQEDEFKFRCKVPDCTKLFKGQTFWMKHVEKRHADWYEKLREDFELVNRYVLDPARLAQGRNDASSNGHFPVNNNLPSGTPRNFSLNNMGFFNNPMAMPGQAPGGPPGFNPFTGQFPMAVPAWGMPGAERGMGGPMRNNGMRNNNSRAPGPYDRGMREPRRSISGRLTPPRRGMFMEGGEHTFGPKQAVEGRTMKSYNDLDAAGSTGGAEALDY